MNTKAIQELLEVLETSGLQSIKYKDNDLEIELTKPQTQLASTVSHPVLLPQNSSTSPTQESTVEKGTALKSPLVGIYYGRPSPDKDTFVSVGKTVKKGDVLCIIEAMKVMNEIKAQASGTVEAVMVNDGETVEFDQPLFRIR